MTDDQILFGMTMAGFAAVATVAVNFFGYLQAHDSRAGRVAKRDLSQVEKKPFHHFLCLCCYRENRHAKTFKPAVLAPDITSVTVKPMSCSNDKIQQVIIKTPNKTRVRYIPASHNEVTIETANGKETFDLRPPLAPSLKIATAPAPVVKGTNTLATAAAQNTRE